MNIGIFVAGEMCPQGEIRKYKFRERKGFNIIEHPICKAEYNGHMAGTPKERAEALHELYRDDRVDIIMSFWGGFNTNEVLKFLDYDLIKDYYKPTIGFSDTTALLSSITKMTGHITYLGPAGITFLKPEPVEYSFVYMQKVISGEKEILINDSDVYADDAYYLRKHPENLSRKIEQNSGRHIIKPGIASGKIVAGNLQTIALLAGTVYFPDIKNSILFLEEDESINDALFRRFLTQISSQKYFSDVKGILFGRFSRNSSITPDQFINSINDILGDMNIPIISNLDFGHTDPMFTIPIGSMAYVNTHTNKIIFNQ